MNTYSFHLNGATLEARPTGTLWWPDARLLCVADLHLGKSERMARRGGTMLAPYETLDTLARLEAEISMLAPAHVVALGDSFDDLRAAAALPDAMRAALTRLTSASRWTWITGNHDPGAPGLPGMSRDSLRLGPLIFRHIALADDGAGIDGEVSGHFHPKARLGATSRPCFVLDGRRVVLPAFGTYTGGLNCLHPDLRGLFGADALAVLTGSRALPVPLGTPQSACRQA